jgi:hypothetical protein
MNKDRRKFLQLAGTGAVATAFPASINRALAIPAHRRTGTIADVEHIVVFMQPRPEDAEADPRVERGWRLGEVRRERALGDGPVARKAAVLHWLEEGFAYAKQIGARGVMIVWQADPNFNNEAHLADTRSWDAFPDYVAALRDLTIAFPGQVALVHGDSPYFKLDKPLNGPSGSLLANFTRVETVGARNTHWLKATIDVEDPNLFSFQPRIVPANAN